MQQAQFGKGNEIALLLQAAEFLDNQDKRARGKCKHNGNTESI